MTKSLIKNDIKKMTKVLVYIYAAAILFAGITRLINIGKDVQFVAIIGYVFSGITYSAIGSVLINTFVHILKTFICNFYKDESYLTHTLPVKKSQLLFSKYISALLVIFMSIAVCFLSLFILFYTPELMDAIKVFFEASIPGFDMSVGLFVCVVILLVFLQICAMISMSFMAVVKCNTYNSKRTIKGFAWFVIYYMGSTIVTVALAVIIFALAGNINNLFTNTLSQSSFVTILIISLIAYLDYAILYYFLSYRLFKKGVNVD